MKTVISALLRSLGLMVVISTLCGAATFFLIGTFFGGFFLMVILQIIGGYVFNTFMERKDRKMIGELLAQSTDFPVPFDLTCAYCHTTNSGVPLSLSLTNTFDCVSCNQTNGVFIQFTTTRITQPLINKEKFGKIKDSDENMKLQDGYIEEIPEPRQTTINDPIEVSSTKKEK